MLSLDMTQRLFSPTNIVRVLGSFLLICLLYLIYRFVAVRKRFLTLRTHSLVSDSRHDLAYMQIATGMLSIE
jgi:hypothetical protein